MWSVGAVAGFLEGFVGVLIALAFVAAILGLIAYVGLRGRRRALRRGTHPLRLLPWYLGGPPETPLETPEEPKRTNRHRA